MECPWTFHGIPWTFHGILLFTLNKSMWSLCGFRGMSMEFELGVIFQVPL